MIVSKATKIPAAPDFLTIFEAKTQAFKVALTRLTPTRKYSRLGSERHKTKKVRT